MACASGHLCSTVGSRQPENWTWQSWLSQIPATSLTRAKLPVIWVVSVMCGCPLRVKVHDAASLARIRCGHVSGLVMRPAWPRAPMRCAVRVPDQSGALGGALTDTVSLAAGLPVSRCHRCFGTLPPAGGGRRRALAAVAQAAAAGVRYVPPRTSSAQAMRAILFASATAATLNGRRASSWASQSARSGAHRA